MRRLLEAEHEDSRILRARFPDAERFHNRQNPMAAY